MTYNEFKAEYRRLVHNLLQHDYGTIACDMATEDLIFLVDCYPEYDDRRKIDAQTDETLIPVIFLPV